MFGSIDLCFDHVGVVVDSVSDAKVQFRDLLGVTYWTEEFVDEVNGVKLVFGRDPAGIVHELLEPLTPDSPVAAALKGKRDLLNHLAYRVPNLEQAQQHLRKARCFPTGKPRAAIAFGGGQVQFFLTPLNTIIEIIEAPGHKHDFRME